MTVYPFEIVDRTGGGSTSITIPAPLGVPDVDAQVDLLAAVQAKQTLAIEREQRAKVAVTDAVNAANEILVESMSTEEKPDLSGDVEVTKAELTYEAAKRITQAANAAVYNEMIRLLTVLSENRTEVRASLWKKVEAARDTLAGAAFSAERASAQLAGSAGLVAALDRFGAEDVLTRFVPQAFGGSFQVNEAATAAQSALSALNGWMDAAYQPAPKKGDPVEVEVDEFDAEVG